jgi:uncharacterized integral membrane protein
LKARLIAAGIVILLAVILTIQNTQPVIVNILFWHPDFPLIVIVITFIVVGFIAGFFARKVAQVITKKDDKY